MLPPLPFQAHIMEDKVNELYLSTKLSTLLVLQTGSLVINQSGTKKKIEQNMRHCQEIEETPLHSFRPAESLKGA